MSNAAAVAVTWPPHAAAAGEACLRLGILGSVHKPSKRVSGAERTTLATREPRRDTGVLSGEHAAPGARYIADAHR